MRRLGWMLVIAFVASCGSEGNGNPTGFEAGNFAGSYDGTFVATITPTGMAPMMFTETVTITIRTGSANDVDFTSVATNGNTCSLLANRDGDVDGAVVQATTCSGSGRTASIRSGGTMTINGATLEVDVSGTVIVTSPSTFQGQYVGRWTATRKP